MSNTLRLLMPQWQGGNNPEYSFGARLLSWLAPSNDKDYFIEVPVEPYNGEKPAKEEGVVARTALKKQLQSATKIIEAYQPERIIMFGGDCLVSQAPFAYLNEKYNDTLGVLWLDAHPDVSTPEMYYHEHAMVLGNLLGEGDLDFSKEVKVPLKPEQVMYGGLQKMTDEEEKIVKRLNLRIAESKELAKSSDCVLAWIKENNIKHLAIHLDLDVLDPKLFRSLLFAKPEPIEIDSSRGDMSFEQVSRLISDVSAHVDIVGLGIAEYLPWDAINFRSFLESLPIFQ